MARGADSLTLRRTRPDKAVGLCKENKVYDEDCQNMLRNVRNRCEVTNDDNSRFRGRRKRLNTRRRRGKKRPIRNMTWKDKHCGKMLLNIRGDAFANRIDELSTKAEEMMGDLEQIAADAGWNMVAEATARYGGKVAARHAGATLICGGGGAAAGSVVPVAGTAAGGAAGAVVCNIGAAVVDVVSGLWTAWDTWSNISEMKDLAAEAYQRVDQARQTADRISEVIEDPSKLDELRQDVMDEMVNAGVNDPCLKARKCFLVPYTPSQQGTYDKDLKSIRGGTTPGIFDAGPMNLGDSRGCCPGQTGHHLIQDAWLKSDGAARGAGDLCSSGNYDDGKAPVVCVEGMDQNTGSHGTIHTETEEELRSHLGRNGGRFTMDDAIDVAANAHENTVGRNTCNKECIKEQLRDYYDRMGCNPRATDKNGGPIGGQPRRGGGGTF